jgi:hypothetical protein
MVGTTKRSIAAMPSAWLRRNVFHPCEGGRQRVIADRYGKGATIQELAEECPHVRCFHPGKFRDGLRSDFFAVLFQSSHYLPAFVRLAHSVGVAKHCTSMAACTQIMLEVVSSFLDTLSQVIGVMIMEEKNWDVFISYASEDRDSTAVPLAVALRRAGVKVWLDQQELMLGDSLSEKIDDGLSRSYFGVVILSKAFFGKQWPKKELAGLRTREEEGHKVILPVWHGVDKKDVREFSPILADAVAVETSDGIEYVADAILRQVFSPSSAASKRSSWTRAMNNILNGESERHVMVDFMCAASRAVELREFGRGGLSIYNERIGETTFDLASIESWDDVNYVTYTFFHFTEFWTDPFEHPSSKPLTVLKGIADRLDQVHGSKLAFQQQLKAIHPILMERALNRRQIYGAEDTESDLYIRLLRSNPRVIFRVYCGRRGAIDLSNERKIAWRNLREFHAAEMDIRSYDAILDQLIEYEKRYA